MSQIASSSTFSANYEEARTNFISKANNCGASLKSYRLPNLNGLLGEVLAIDTAWLGPDDAENVLVTICGTHGQEGFAGSAVQSQWLAKHSKDKLPLNYAVMFIHAANPYGFSYLSRTTENNVDLNRNFVEDHHFSVESEVSSKVHKALQLGGLKGPEIDLILNEISMLSNEYGQSEITNFVTKGQYSFPNSIGYGGSMKEWANLTLSHIWQTELAKSKQVSIIDWHTGLGQYGKPFLLCFDDKDSKEFELAHSYWGKCQSETNEGFASHTQPDYRGLLVTACQSTVRNMGVKAVGAVIEFGTYSNMEMLSALLIDNWLRTHGENISAELKSQLRNKALQLFCPDDATWQNDVIKHGCELIDNTIFL